MMWGMMRLVFLLVMSLAGVAPLAQAVDCVMHVASAEAGCHGMVALAHDVARLKVSECIVQPAVMPAVGLLVPPAPQSAAVLSGPIGEITPRTAFVAPPYVRPPDRRRVDDLILRTGRMRI